MKKFFVLAAMLLTLSMMPCTLAKSVPQDLALVGVNTESRALGELCAGRPLYINFWATWCPPCVGEMPAINSLSAKYADRVSFAAISVDSDAESPVSFARKNGLTVPVYTADLRAINSAFDFDAIPYSVLVDASGSIIAEHLGAMSESELEAFISKAL